MKDLHFQTCSKSCFRETLIFWLVPAWVGLIVAFPFIYAAWHDHSEVLIRLLTGDAYHYLAIGRKSIMYNMFTYDGLTVTNGFHPFWQYIIRAQFYLFDLKNHSEQALTVVIMSLIAVTIGSILTSAAIIRFTQQKYLGLLVVPGVFYLLIGVHANCLSIWSSIDGMESALSVLFGGFLYFKISKHINISNLNFDMIRSAQVIGLIFPLIVLSRLDDVFLVPAFLIAVILYNCTNEIKFKAVLWLTLPTGLTLFFYLIYNLITVGAAMPLSGMTKAGFIGPTTLYLTSAIHFPPLIDIKNFLVEKQSNGRMTFENKFRFIELLYPLLFSVIGLYIIIVNRIKNGMNFLMFGIFLYILFKIGYNFLFVHPWHQSSWYYAFINISLTVLFAIILNNLLADIKINKIGKSGVLVFYVLMMLFLSSNQLNNFIYGNWSEGAPEKFWAKKDSLRATLIEKHVSGLINVDDGITAFLLDFPCMHGFAFATDVEAQKAFREGKMLSLALSRGINTFTGFGYMPPIVNQTNFKQNPLEYLKNSLAWETMFAEADKFEFELAYYDEDLKLPFILFRQKSTSRPVEG